MRTQPDMSESFRSAVHRLITKLSAPIRKTLSETLYNPPPGSISVEAILEDLLPKPSDEKVTASHVRSSVRGFALACALLASSKSSDHDLLSWIPEDLSSYAELAFGELSEAYSAHSELSLVMDLMPEVVPPLKDAIKESSTDSSQDVDEISAASARTPVGLAIVAAYQFRWFVTQIGHPHLGKLCSLLIPCALTALDHWSPEVKGQGMVSFIHIGKIVDTNEIGCYEGVILDACCHNIASSDEIWHLVVEMSVLFVTRTHPSNPRVAWFERILGEMLSHLERQPRNKDRRVAWLQHSEALFNSLGLLLVAHFRRIFPLFFQWMRADDDETVLLVLEQVHTILRLSWIRNTPYNERLGIELDALYKGASLKKSCEDIRRQVSQILILLREINAFHACEALQFQAASDKPRDDPNMTNVCLQEEGMVQR